jgi:hypothetical protein
LPFRVDRSQAAESFPACPQSKAVGPALVVTLHAKIEEIPDAVLVGVMLSNQ